MGKNLTGGDFLSGVPKECFQSGNPCGQGDQNQPKVDASQLARRVVYTGQGGGHLSDSHFFGQSEVVDPGAVVTGLRVVKK